MSSVPPNGAADEPEAFHLEEEVVSDIPVLHLVGEVDLAAAPTVRERLTSLAQRPGEARAGGRSVVVVDLADVTFIDSTGLSMLVAAHTRFEETNDELRVAAVPSRVQRVLELTGLDGLLRTYGDVPSALRGSEDAPS